MKNNKLAQKQDLCAFLNMNFDEANELFSSETLSNMKMAQINGGFVISGTTFAVISISIGLTTVGLTVYELFFSDGTSVTEQGSIQMKGEDLIYMNGDTLKYYSSEKLENGYTKYQIIVAPVNNPTTAAW